LKTHRRARGVSLTREHTVDRFARVVDDVEPAETVGRSRHSRSDRGLVAYVEGLHQKPVGRFAGPLGPVTQRRGDVPPSARNFSTVRRPMPD
jgi:hypothetical protein